MGSLRDLAQADMIEIHEDFEDGFGWPITVTDPSGTTKSLIGFSQDIAQSIDPDTDQIVSGRTASISLPIASLVAAGFSSLPEGVADATLKPWLVAFDDIDGNPYTFKVAESAPDRTIGRVTCFLEIYKVAP